MKKEALQIIPMSEVAAKNEPEMTTGVTRDEIPVVLFVPPQPQGMDPQKNGGFGSSRDAETVWEAIGMTPLQTWLAALNDWLRQEAIRFASFELAPPMARKTYVVVTAPRCGPTILAPGDVQHRPVTTQKRQNQSVLRPSAPSYPAATDGAAF